MITCLVVDDEEPARDLLKAFIEKVPNLECLGFLKNPVAAAEMLNKQKVDLVFLDIQMPEISGLDFLELLHEKPKVILTTAYEEYALKSYELEVVDYLLKPFSFQRFLRGVNRATGLLEKEHKHSNNSEFLTIKAEHKLIRLKTSEIIYIEGMREYVGYHTTEKRILSLQSLKSLERNLPEFFHRIHKSFIVNSHYVKVLDGHQIILEGGIRIPIGASYKEAVLKNLF